MVVGCRICIQMWNFWTDSINTPKKLKNFRTNSVPLQSISGNENWVFDFRDSTLLQKLHSTFYITGKMHPSTNPSVITHEVKQTLNKLSTTPPEPTIPRPPTQGPPIPSALSFVSPPNS